jgi:hypothetical protein
MTMRGADSPGFRETETIWRGRADRNFLERARSDLRPSDYWLFTELKWLDARS